MLPIAAALAALGTGCGGAGDDVGARVLAASSLTGVLADVVPDARYSFGGTNQLAEQVRQGAPFDVFLAASPRDARRLHAEGLVREPRPFAGNRLVLIVPRGNPAGVRSAADLARAQDVRLVVAGPRVPAGAYTAELLRRLGLERVLDSVASKEPDVKGVVGKVALGEADAGIVYATDALAVADDVETVELPAHAQPDVIYEAAVATAPRDRGAATAFLDELLGPEGRARLAEAGFTLP